jgi:hypothetical protein
MAYLHPDTALKHFKTRKAMAEAASVSRQAVSVWFKEGLIPDRSARILMRAMKSPRRRA